MTRNMPFWFNFVHQKQSFIELSYYIKLLIASFNTSAFCAGVLNSTYYKNLTTLHSLEENIIIRTLWPTHVSMGGFNGRISASALRSVSTSYEKDNYIFDFTSFWIILWPALVAFKSGIKITREKKLDRVINETS